MPSAPPVLTPESPVAADSWSRQCYRDLHAAWVHSIYSSVDARGNVRTDAVLLVLDQPTPSPARAE
eukprot:43010-Eustigmatos_ZCMA.PRE.1